MKEKLDLRRGITHSPDGATSLFYNHNCRIMNPVIEAAIAHLERSQILWTLDPPNALERFAAIVLVSQFEFLTGEKVDFS
ncbi:MAG: hypothetical protein EOQ39_18620 [Mesorhizobium sp.]|uniref:hypothetical protein n=1 Tax=Mesorhizobium sp. TaxID=1871066 RepID=UPI000FE4D3AC|nr:hypothetical protein [Mesorhizobium sp.]RWB08816.1 MAG: hypothetical protein EOQ37_04725 [Mesorhizobium sp.]RWB13534.1 MAG: hypothetical protein EOQ39_18620 [Mesorhizobium sp.]